MFWKILHKTALVMANRARAKCIVDTTTYATAVIQTSALVMVVVVMDGDCVDHSNCCDDDVCGDGDGEGCVHECGNVDSCDASDGDACVCW